MTTCREALARAKACKDYQESTTTRGSHTQPQGLTQSSSNHTQTQQNHFRYRSTPRGGRGDRDFRGRYPQNTQP
jgi:hypothetical protein